MEQSFNKGLKFNNLHNDSLCLCISHFHLGHVCVCVWFLYWPLSLCGCLVNCVKFITFRSKSGKNSKMYSYLVWFANFLCFGDFQIKLGQLIDYGKSTQYSMTVWVWAVQQIFIGYLDWLFSEVSVWTCSPKFDCCDIYISKFSTPCQGHPLAAMLLHNW